MHIESWFKEMSCSLTSVVIWAVCIVFMTHAFFGHFGQHPQKSDEFLESAKESTFTTVKAKHNLSFFIQVLSHFWNANTILFIFRNTEHLLIVIMDRIRESRSWLDTFHLKQTVQTIMYRFLDLYKDLEWKC